VVVETDTVGNTTTYQLGAPVQVTLPSNSSMKGAGQTKVDLLGSTKLPPLVGPLKGVFGKQSTKVGRAGWQYSPDFPGEVIRGLQFAPEPRRTRVIPSCFRF
jgi:hypothetical protein